MGAAGGPFANRPRTPTSHRMSAGGRRTGPPAPSAASWPAADPKAAPEVPASRPSRTRLLVGTAIVVPVLALGLIGGLLALRSSWYVGERNGRVAVFRGVPGSFAGIRVSSLAHMTDIRTVSLVQPAQ